MKNSPFWVAVVSIGITLFRVAAMVRIIDGGFGEILSIWFSWTFALIVASGVYVSSFMVRFKPTRVWAIIALIFFGLCDLAFNEAAVIYYTSTAQFVPPTANFMGIGSDYLLIGFQFFALFFGGVPTLSAVMMGALQAGVYKVAELNRPGIIASIAMALGKIVRGWGAAFAIELGRRSENAPQFGINPPQNDRQLSAGKPRHWLSLTADEVAIIPAKSRPELMALFGISDGAAGD